MGLRAAWARPASRVVIGLRAALGLSLWLLPVPVWAAVPRGSRRTGSQPRAAVVEAAPPQRRVALMRSERGAAQERNVLPAYEDEKEAWDENPGGIEEHWHAAARRHGQPEMMGSKGETGKSGKSGTGKSGTGKSGTGKSGKSTGKSGKSTGRSTVMTITSATRKPPDWWGGDAKPPPQDWVPCKTATQITDMGKASTKSATKKSTTKKSTTKKSTTKKSTTKKSTTKKSTTKKSTTKKSSTKTTIKSGTWAGKAPPCDGCPPAPCDGCPPAPVAMTPPHEEEEDAPRPREPPQEPPPPPVQQPPPPPPVPVQQRPPPVPVQQRPPPVPPPQQRPPEPPPDPDCPDCDEGPPEAGPPLDPECPDCDDGPPEAVPREPEPTGPPREHGGGRTVDLKSPPRGEGDQIRKEQHAAAQGKLFRCDMPMWQAGEYVCDESAHAPPESFWTDPWGNERLKMDSGSLCTVRCPHVWLSTDVQAVICHDGRFVINDGDGGSSSSAELAAEIRCTTALWMTCCIVLCLLLILGCFCAGGYYLFVSFRTHGDIECECPCENRAPDPPPPPEPEHHGLYLPGGAHVPVPRPVGEVAERAGDVARGVAKHLPHPFKHSHH